jgi:hypothetical protein
MLKSFDLKFYRQLMVLAVLFGYLYVFTSVPAGVDAARIPCCSIIYANCNNNYDNCTESCYYYYPQNPARLEQCLTQCDAQYNLCMGTLCDSGC